MCASEFGAWWSTRACQVSASLPSGSSAFFVDLRTVVSPPLGSSVVLPVREGLSVNQPGEGIERAIQECETSTRPTPMELEGRFRRWRRKKYRPNKKCSCLPRHVQNVYREELL